MNRPQPGEIYRHFKGFKALIITIAKHTETNEEMVIYCCVGDATNSEHHLGIYARPLSMFLSKVDKEKYPDVEQVYRFELMKDSEVNDKE